jgi:hypothetical protein
LSGIGAGRITRRVNVLVALEPETGVEPEDAERLGRQLRDELRALDVEDVTAVAGGPPPAGAKGGVAGSLTELLVTLSGGGGVIVTVLATLKDWLSRRTGGHKITVTIDGDTLELSSATPAEREELVETFVRRHQPV